MNLVHVCLFDLYGTLVDVTVDEESDSFWQRLAENLGREGIRTEGTRLQEEYRRFCESAVRHSGEGFILEEVFKQLLVSLDREATSKNVEDLAERFRSLSIKSLQIRPYAAPLIEILTNSGCKTALTSNTEGIFTRFDLRRCGLDRAFDAIVLSSEVGIKKPDPRIFRLALRLVNVEASHAVFMGDNPQEDIHGAQRAGLRSLFVNPKGPDFVAGDLEPTPQVVGVFPSLQSIERGLRNLGWQP